MAPPIRVNGSLAGLLLVAIGATALGLPFAHYISWTGDEGILPHAAARLLRGETLYRDFFEFHPPGGILLVEGWMAFGGRSAQSLRWLGIGSIAAVALVSYLACNRAGRHWAVSAALALAWTLSSQGAWTQLNHHWFATLLSMTVAWCALGRGTPAAQPAWPALLAGLAAGSSAMITPHQGALTCLAGLAGFTGKGGWRPIAAYLAGCAVTPVCLLAYILGNGAGAEAYQDIILFTLGEYGGVQSVPYGNGGDLQGFPLLLVFPAAGLAGCALAALDLRGARSDRDLWVCTAMCGAGFLACFPRPDMPHLAFAAPLALPLLAKTGSRLIGGWSVRRQIVLLAVAGVIGLPVAWTYAKLAHKVLDIPRTPVGDGTALAFADRSIAGIIPQLAKTPAQDGYLFYPYMPLMPVITDRRHVAQVDIFLPGYTTAAQYYDACLATMRQADWIVVDHQWTDPAYLARIFPRLKGLMPPETRGFDAAIARGFVHASEAGKVELLRRGPAADEALCAPILGNT